MNKFIDIGYESLNKHSEELCGDKVKIVEGKDNFIIVLADGLGSGVKANILSTLTATIAATMLKNGANIFEVIDTLTHTLPTCKVRQLAYSTFTILQVFNNGNVYIVEFDNPPIIFIKEGQINKIKSRSIKIHNKIIKESSMTLKEGDMITAISDGVVHAGIGGVLNLGWQWEQVSEYLLKIYHKEKNAKNITKNLIRTCKDLYLNKPGDDTTAITVKLRTPERVSLFTGPPKDREKDPIVVKKFMEIPGKKIICGGTAANIVSRELNREIITDLSTIKPDIPPMAKMKGFDLVTEGVLTLCKTVEIIKSYRDGQENYNPYSLENNKDGASSVAKLLLEDCTHLDVFIGDAMNPAHQNPDFPIELSMKEKIIIQLTTLLKKMGIIVTVNNV